MEETHLHVLSTSLRRRPSNPSRRIPDSSSECFRFKPTTIHVVCQWILNKHNYSRALTTNVASKEFILVSRHFVFAKAPRALISILLSRVTLFVLSLTVLVSFSLALITCFYALLSVWTTKSAICTYIENVCLKTVKCYLNTVCVVCIYECM